MSHRLYFPCALESASDRIFRRRRGGLARERRPNDAAVLVGLQAEGKAQLDEDFLDLVEGLAAKVLCLLHFVFALLAEFTNGLDIWGLQAGVGTHGKLVLLPW